MQHLDEGTIHTWLDGALSPDEAARVEAHVAECPQCAAAVAEARGFIAASSRILTALDHVPRGVVPIARPPRWTNPAMWRAAAAVLVVAAGSLVVVRNTGTRSAATEFSKAENASVVQQASPTAIADSPSQAAVAERSMQLNTARSAKTTGKRAATGAVAATDKKPPAATAATALRIADLARAPSAPSNVVASDNDAAAAPTAPVASDRAEKVVPASGYANIQPAPPIVLRGNVTALSVGESISALGPLKVVGRPTQTGAKITLYEVTPTDTVTLTEFMNAQLESVVVAGRSAATPTRERMEGQAAGKGVAAPSPQRMDEQARARVVPAPVTAVGTANGVTTVTWTDASSGNVLKLSGRLPLAQLQQIKIRIERERAASAAKNNP